MSVRPSSVGRAILSLAISRPMNEEQLLFLNRTLSGALEVELLTLEEFALLGSSLDLIQTSEGLYQIESDLSEG